MTDVSYFVRKHCLFTTNIFLEVHPDLNLRHLGLNYKHLGLNFTTVGTERRTLGATACSTKFVP